MPSTPGTAGTASEIVRKSRVGLRDRVKGLRYLVLSIQDRKRSMLFEGSRVEAQLVEEDTERPNVCARGRVSYPSSRTLTEPSWYPSLPIFSSKPFRPQTSTSSGARYCSVVVLLISSSIF